MNAAYLHSTRTRRWWFAVLSVGVLLSSGALAVSLTIINTSGGAGGVENGSLFLTHWQQTGVLSALTPNPVPPRASVVVATPTRLPGASGSLSLDPAVAGDQALEWTFTESVALPINEEVEIAFDVQYTVGAVPHTATATVFLESQAVAIGAPLTFNLYWDTGAPGGATFGAESEISQACTGVGACP
jgi:hypothetical protein